MEPKRLYIVSERMKSKIIWPKNEHPGWTYFGAGSEIKYDFVMELINKHFHNELLYVCWTRKNSFTVEKNKFLNDAKHIIGNENFIIWNTSFSKAIQFNKIRVLKCGTI